MFLCYQEVISRPLPSEGASTGFLESIGNGSLASSAMTVRATTSTTKSPLSVEEVEAEGLPLFYMERDTASRKPRDVLVFRVKGLSRRDVMRWTVKKNERLVGRIVEQRFIETHCKILYMLSYYGVIARSADSMESWMRQIPFNVLTYEAIVKTCLDLDYAPISIVVCADGAVRRIFMNISQEGQSMIDDLREAGHINGLKVQTQSFVNQTMFQVSARGLQLLDVMPSKWKAEVDRFLFMYEQCSMVLTNNDGNSDKAAVTSAPCVITHDPDLKLQVRFENGRFVLFNNRGFRRESLVTETEDVSYCSSPYLPLCLRGPKPKPFKSNAYRASECAGGGDGGKKGVVTSDVADELDEIMAMDGCTTMVVEYIPCGANQLVSLNERLGSLDRCQGGFFTNQQDSSPNDTKFNIPVGLTDVVILEFDFTRYINFEAHIQFAETGAIVQVEEFGMHLNVDGTVIYGLRVEAIDDSLQDNISVDKLSRMLVDVHQDSTRIMDDMLTPYQKNLMDIVFNNDTQNRGKYNVIVADAIKPANHQEASFDYLVAENFMDRGEVENELRQVVNEIESSTIINHRNVLILGRGGCIFAGPDAHHHEADLVLFSRLLVREKFLGFFFARCFMLDTVMERIGHLIVNYYKDPHHVQEGRDLINQTSRVVILMRELLGYIDDSLSEIQFVYLHDDEEEAPRDRTKLELHRMLDAPGRLQALKFRCRDLKKLLTGIDHGINILQDQLRTVANIQSELVVRSIDSNFKALVSACAAQERTAISSKVMETIFSSDLAMRVVDRLVGESMTGNTGPQGIYQWIDRIAWCVSSYPGLFWASIIVWTGGLLYALNIFMKHLLDQASDSRSVVYTIDRAINCKALESLCYSPSKPPPAYVDHLVERRTKFNPGRHLVKVALAADVLPVEERRRWPGEPPRMVLTYNQSIGFLIKARLDWSNRRLRVVDDAEVFRLFNEWLYRHGVYGDRWWEEDDEGVAGGREATSAGDGGGSTTSDDGGGGGDGRVGGSQSSGKVVEEVTKVVPF